MTKAHSRSGMNEKARHHLKRAGYATGGMTGHSDAAEDKKLITRAINEHDAQLHGGKKTHLKLKTGGAVEGKKAGGRLDKLARGGSHKPKGKPHVTVNVMNQPHPLGSGAAGVPPVGIGMAPPGLTGGPRPPVVPPTGGGMPGLPGSPVPPGGMKTGGRLGGREAPKMEAGAASGEGRLEKEIAQKKRK